MVETEKNPPPLRTQTCAGRFGSIAAGYATAVGAAGLAMTLGFTLVTIAGNPSTPAPPWYFSILSMIPVAIFMMPFIALLCAVPAALVVWLAERRGLRSPVFYAAAGAATAVVVVGSLIALSRRSQTSSGVTVSELGQSFAVFGLPGLSAGLAYWAVAGRTAGSCRAPARASSSAA